MAPSLAISLSEVSVIRGQQESKNIKWKIPEINNSYVLNGGTVLSSMIKSCAFLLGPTQDVNHPLVQLLSPTSPFLAVAVITSTAVVLQCLCSNNPYFA